VLEQVRRRQERIVLLSQSLSERGLPFSGLSSISEAIVKGTGGGTKIAQPPEWVCEVSTEEDPKSCLIWGDAEPGTKVVRPKNAPRQWCGLAALNSLRRRDPIKASRLWFDQYLIDMSRFSHDAGPLGVALAWFLDRPDATRAATTWLCSFCACTLRPLLELLVVAILTSGVTWRQYALWSPIVHAPLPLKLLIIRQTYLTLVYYFALLEKYFVYTLADLESRLYESTALALSTTEAPQPRTGLDFDDFDDDDDDDDL